MALNITEIFGYDPTDASGTAQDRRRSCICPFTEQTCKKRFRSDGVIHGTCTVQPPGKDEVVCCPNRLYAENYKILRDAASEAFGGEVRLIRPDEVASTQGTVTRVVVFGTGWGGELAVPHGDGAKGGGYSADWVLALIDETAQVKEFIPLEVQSIDTTGSYQAEWCRLMGLDPPRDQGHGSNMNWENVNKRIIPQLLTKGNVFRREELCRKGLFFVCPTPVYRHMLDRLGGNLQDYGYERGALTFRTYSLDPQRADGSIRGLVFDGQFTTTVDHLRDLFNSTFALPPRGVMGQKIQQRINESLTRSQGRRTRVV